MFPLNKERVVKLVVEAAKVFVYAGSYAVLQHFGLLGVFGM